MADLPDDALAGDDPVGQIEDLDPEPPRPARRAARWEVLLGLLLVGGLAGFGLVSWWAEATRLQQYQAGQRAAAIQDWETASLAYSAAGDFRGARARAVQARGLVAARDTQYTRAVRAAGAGDWLNALQASDRLQQ